MNTQEKELEELRRQLVELNKIIKSELAQMKPAPTSLFHAAGTIAQKIKEMKECMKLDA